MGMNTLSMYCANHLLRGQLRNEEAREEEEEARVEGGWVLRLQDMLRL